MAVETKDGQERVYRAGFVALAGPPNVGKSTLLNTLLGTKVAIVTPKPQTTRTVIRGIVHRPGAQMVLVDTPGIHRPSHLLGQHMVQAARSQIQDVDLVWQVADLTRPPRTSDRAVAALVAAKGDRAWLLGNKADAAARPAETLEAYAALAPYGARFVISALTGQGVGELLEAAFAAMPEGVPYYPEGMVTDQTEEQLVAETIREKVLQLTREEVPHSVAVGIEERVERSPELTYYRAVIYVEREGQKGILIGQGGRMLKAVGEAARLDLEARFGRRLYLDLWVKVRRHWRDQEAWLRRLGLAGR